MILNSTRGNTRVMGSIGFDQGYWIVDCVPRLVGRPRQKPTSHLHGEYKNQKRVDFAYPAYAVNGKVNAFVA